MNQESSIAITDLLLKLMKQETTIPAAIDEIEHIVEREVEIRCGEKVQDRPPVTSDNISNKKTPPVPLYSFTEAGNLEIQEAGRILDFMNYFRNRLSEDDPLYPVVVTFNDMLKDLDEQPSLKDKQISCALKSTYLCDRKDLQRNNGVTAVAAYQKLLEDDPYVETDKAAISKTTYYDAKNDGIYYFLHRCNTTLDEATIDEIKRFVHTADHIKTTASLPIAYRDYIASWLNQREKALKKEKME